MARTGFFLFSILVIFSVAPGLQALSAEQKVKIHEYFIKIGMMCMKETPIDEQDINNLKNKKPVEGADTPCFLACIYRAIGAMDDQGMLQKETALEKIKEVFEEPEEQKNAEKFLHVCTNDVNAEAVTDGAKGCERAHKAYLCMIEKASQFGIDM